MTKERECDQLLVDRAKDGCRNSFDVLVFKYQRRLMRVITYLVFDRAQAEDLVQESFIKAYRGLAYFRGDSAFFTWLYAIGINEAKSFLAKQAKRNASLIQLGIQEGPTYADAGDLRDMNTPDSLLESKELTLAINSAIHMLPLDERTAIVLRELELLNYKQIALIMECPVGTVRCRIFRAREAIIAKICPLRDSSRTKHF